MVVAVMVAVVVVVVVVAAVAAVAPSPLVAVPPARRGGDVTFARRPPNPQSWDCCPQRVANGRSCHHRLTHAGSRAKRSLILSANAVDKACKRLVYSYAYQL